MNINKYTEKAQAAVVAAGGLAEQLNHPQIEPEHLLLALVEQADGVVPDLVRRIGVDPAQMAATLRTELAKGPQAYGGAQPQVSARFRRVAEAAESVAAGMKDEFVSTEHLLLALAAESGHAPAARVLQDAGVTHQRMLEALAAVRGSQRVTDQNPEAKYQALERYGRDLTELARRDRLDPGGAFSLN